jgi:hypothetical protein
MNMYLILNDYVDRAPESPDLTPLHLSVGLNKGRSLQKKCGYTTCILTAAACINKREDELKQHRASHISCKVH